MGKMDEKWWKTKWIIKDEGGWMIRNKTDDERWIKDDGWDETKDDG